MPVWRTLIALTALCSVAGCGMFAGEKPSTKAAPGPTATVAPISPSPDVPADERDDPGTVWPLEISAQTWKAAAEAAKKAPEGEDVAGIGSERPTGYYGVVFGKKPKDDRYYLVRGFHLWTRTGTGPWRYRGAFGDCDLPVPTRLLRAWGTAPHPSVSPGSESPRPCPADPPA
ncbi:hypothetical protein GCM10022221_19260 [Actinocorallia aurea]